MYDKVNENQNCFELNGKYKMHFGVLELRDYMACEWMLMTLFTLTIWIRNLCFNVLNALKWVEPGIVMN